MRSTTTLLAVLLLSLPAGAHDFWIRPAQFAPAPESVLAVHLRVGDHARGEPVTRKDQRIVRFMLVDAAGERAVVGRDGALPAGAVRTAAAGVATLGYHSTPARLELEATKFEAYLREEGLEAVIAERARRGESALAGRERYERCCKSLVQVGGEGRGGGATLGLPLEFVVIGDPFDPDAADLELELRFEGRPLADARVGVLPLGEDDPAAPPAEERVLQSDERGRLRVPRAGRWLIAAVHMQRAAPGEDADWHSWWGSLTYEGPVAR
jgi:uncharacterized GH25 family protein